MEKKFISIMQNVDQGLGTDRMNMFDQETLLEQSKRFGEVLMSLRIILDRINTLNEISVQTKTLISNTALERLKSAGVNLNKDHSCEEIKILNTRSNNTYNEIDILSNKGLNEIKEIFERFSNVMQS